MIRVIGQREVSRKIDFDAVPLADGHRRQDVEKAVENLRGGLRGTLRKSLPHEVGAGRGQRPRRTGLGNGADRAYRERGSENAQVVIVDLIAKTGVADLIQALEMVETCRIPIRHDQAMKRNGKAGLAKTFHLAAFAE